LIVLYDSNLFLHNGLDIEVYDLHPADVHYYCCCCCCCYY